MNKEQKPENIMSGLIMKYFVLKPRGHDVYAEASRKAMRAYARHIAQENPELAQSLEEWANRETEYKLNKGEKT